MFEGDIAGILGQAEEALLGKKENELGYVFTERKVSFSGRSFFYGSMISSKAGAGNPYWSLVGDQSGFLYVALPSSFYEGNAKKYAGQENQYFAIEGRIASFRGKTIVEATSYEFLPSPGFAVTNEALKPMFGTDALPLEEAHREIAAMPLNVKGCAYGEPRLLEGKIAAKMDDGVFLFTDGAHYLKLHGTKTALSNLEPGFSYRLYVVLDEYIYAPGAEVLFAEGIEKEVRSPAPAKSVTAASTYAWTYENNVMDHATAYESTFKDLYSVDGYVTTYQKDGALSFVVSDSPRPEGFSAYTGARDAKCLFIKNKTETNLKTEIDLSYSVLAPFDPSEKVRIEFVPYLWNASKYFQGYLLSASRVVGE